MPDVNFWVAFAFEHHPLRPAALAWWKGERHGKTVFFNRATEQGFLRLSSNPAVLQKYNVAANTNRDALKALKGFLALPGLESRGEPDGIEELWHRLAGVDDLKTGLWMDAYLAAFAICGSLNLVTFDKDFRVFQKEGLALTVLNQSPLTKSD